LHLGTSFAIPEIRATVNFPRAQLVSNISFGYIVNSKKCRGLLQVVSDFIEKIFKTWSIIIMKKTTNKKGFTLVELLVVVAIIGILASIAIPQFAAYRERANDAAANSDIRTVMTAQETYFIDNNAYAANLTNLNATITVNTSTGVLIGLAGDNLAFDVTSCSTSGSGVTFEFCSSNVAGLVKNPAPASGAACTAAPAAAVTSGVC